MNFPETARMKLSPGEKRIRREIERTVGEEGLKEIERAADETIRTKIERAALRVIGRWAREQPAPPSPGEFERLVRWEVQDRLASVSESDFLRLVEREFHARRIDGRLPPGPPLGGGLLGLAGVHERQIREHRDRARADWKRNRQRRRSAGNGKEGGR